MDFSVMEASQLSISRSLLASAGDDCFRAILSTLLKFFRFLAVAIAFARYFFEMPADLITSWERTCVNLDELTFLEL